MHHEEEKNIHKSHLTISHIYLEIYFTKSKTKNRHLVVKGKLFNYTIAHRATGLIGVRYVNITRHLVATYTLIGKHLALLTSLVDTVMLFSIFPACLMVVLCSPLWKNDHCKCGVFSVLQVQRLCLY